MSEFVDEPEAGENDNEPLSLKDLLYEILLVLVTEPDKIEIEETTVDENSTALNVRVSSADVGRVLGKQGRLVEAIRHIFVAAAQGQHRKIYLAVDAPAVQKQAQLIARVAPTVEKTAVIRFPYSNGRPRLPKTYMP